MVEQRTSIAQADLYLLFGLLGKKVIHPGMLFDTVEDWLDRLSESWPARWRIPWLGDECCG